MEQTDHYPRNMIGYGSTPPHPRWPHEAKLAVSVVLNYEEGGESCVLHGDVHSEYKGWLFGSFSAVFNVASSLSLQLLSISTTFCFLRLRFAAPRI